MSDLSRQLKPFEKRVRLVRAWLGSAIGGCVGTAASAVWAFCDWRSIFYTEWSWMAFLTAASAVLGAIAGYAMKVAPGGLAASIDRRAGLKDRLSTAHEREHGTDPFDAALVEDAEEKLARVRPNTVYPLKVGKWHAGALIFATIAAAVFVLGNTPVALSEDARRDRQDLKKQGETVKRILKENFEAPDAQPELSAAEKRLADELRRFDRDLEKAHVSKEDALQKANELSQKADELMQQAAKASQASLAQAETARQGLEKAQMANAGLSGASPQMAQMSSGDLSDRLDKAKREAKQIESELERLKRELAEIIKKLADKTLSQAERKRLEERKAEIEKRIEELTRQLKANADKQKAIELSQEAQKVFERMMSDPKFKQLMQLEEMLSQNSKSMAKSGQPKLTDEELKRMREALEQLAKSLKDDKAMQAYLDALLDAMMKAKMMGRGAGVKLSLQGIPVPGLSPAGPGDTTPGIWTGDTGRIHKLDAPTASRGTTHEDVISGEQRPSDGPQPYIEIRAPSTVGNRSSVPYKDVLPSYEKKAESALNRQQIPKEHQRRVKEYFDSLTGAKKG